MPSYDYQCVADRPCTVTRPNTLGVWPKVTNLRRDTDDRDLPAVCAGCGGPTRRLFNGASQLKMVSAGRRHR
jgi:hypothetical protein